MISSPVIQSRGESTLDRSSSPTVWLYQIITDIWIGTDNAGADMFMPVAIDLFYSQETGGRNATYRWGEWESTKKELRVRGYDYRGKLLSRSTKEGQDLENTCQQYIDWVTSALLAYNPDNPHGGEIQYVEHPFVPAWVYLSLVVTVIAMMFVLLQFINR